MTRAKKNNGKQPVSEACGDILEFVLEPDILDGLLTVLEVIGRFSVLFENSMKFSELEEGVNFQVIKR